MPRSRNEFTVTIGGQRARALRHEGLLPDRSRNYTPGSRDDVPLSDGASWTPPRPSPPARWRSAGSSSRSSSSASSSRRVIYPVYANWVWGGGWLSQLGKKFGLGHGHVDFAGSSVVHMTGGVAALVGAKMIGPRIGKYNADGSPNPIPGHNIPMALLGTFILAFGWFGFNPARRWPARTRASPSSPSTPCSLRPPAPSRACVYVWTRYGKPDPTWLANGMLAGLVAITAPCAFVGAPAAIAHRRHRRRSRRRGRPCSSSRSSRSTTRWARRASTACAAPGASSRSASSPTASYGDGLNGVRRPGEGALYGDAGQFMAECIGVLANVVYVGTACGHLPVRHRQDRRQPRGRRGRDDGPRHPRDGRGRLRDRTRAHIDEPRPGPPSMTPPPLRRPAPARY